MTQRLLIAEDIAIIATDLELIARNAGVEVVAIVDSLEGAREAVALAPDIAVVDLNLSDGFTGPYVGHELSRLCSTRVIYFTANPDLLPAEIHEQHQVLRKPLIAHELVNALFTPGEMART